MDFKQFLREKQFLPENKIKFYLLWLSKYHSFCKESKLKDQGTNLREEFLKKLTNNHESWQVLQAKEAIRLHKYYIDIDKYNKHKSVTPLTNNLPTLENAAVKALRLQHLSYRTEQSYLGWLKRFYYFLDNKPPDTINQDDLKNFLSYLAVDRRVSASTQRQAFNALLFIFRYVLHKKIHDLDDAVRSRIPRRLPTVLTKSEISEIFKHLQGIAKLMASVSYGGGLRLHECLSLRIKDIDFERNYITVRSGKGDKDRQTLLPENLKNPLQLQFDKIRPVYEEDRKNKIEGVWLPEALNRKYPSYSKEWGWFWLFPSYKLSVDPSTKIIRRHHMYSSTFQRAFRKAVSEAGITKNATIHTLRHSFATHLLESGYDIRTVQELLGHSTLQTTMIYTHIAQKNMLGVKSPFDSINDP